MSRSIALIGCDAPHASKMIRGLRSISCLSAPIKASLDTAVPRIPEPPEPPERVVRGRSCIRKALQVARELDCARPVAGPPRALRRKPLQALPAGVAPGQIPHLVENSSVFVAQLGPGG